MSGQHEHPEGHICIVHSPIETILIARALLLCIDKGHNPVFSQVQAGALVHARVEFLEGEDLLVFGGMGSNQQEAAFRLCMNLEELFSEAGAAHASEVQAPHDKSGRMVN